MASIRESCRALRQLPLSQASRLARPATVPFSFRRCATTQASQEGVADLETESSIQTPVFPTEAKDWKPQFRPKDGERSLPKSRYQYRPPRYDRGPLHPVQSPASSDPVARDFVPGPFNLPRLRQTFDSTLAPDLMTLAYLHKPPGTEKRIYESGLRSWDGSSPYHKNRPLRAARGRGGLGLVERDITFNNIPELTAITISIHAPEATRDTEYLMVARSVLQSLSGHAPEILRTKESVQRFRLVKGKKAGVRVTIYGNEAYEFLDKCIHLVFPRIKEWKGIPGSTGDSSGNLSWGFSAEDMALFPEIEANYPFYPVKKMPGCRVFVKTTATSDRQARLLLKSMGLPFYGKLVN